MAKRFKLSRGSSKKMFSRNSGSHPKNRPMSGAMRGGIRL